jgi:hypothetical protein
MPGLLRGLVRTAAVAGTATAVSGRIQRRQAAKFAQRDAATAVARDQAYLEQTAPQAAAAPPATDRLEQLKTLGELRQSGVLTDAEFDAQKARILAG